MKKRTRVLLKKTIGYYLIIIGLIVLVSLLFPKIFTPLYLTALILFFSSINFIVIAFRYRKFIIVGINLLLLAIFLVLYNALFYKINLTMDKIWPSLGIIPAISMAVYYIISKKKRPSIIIPATFIFLLSTVLLLFSTQIIKISFTKFLLLLLAGIFILFGMLVIFTNKIKIFDSKKVRKKINKEVE